DSNYHQHKIARITLTGHVSEFSLPHSFPGEITTIIAGSDGALWFTEVLFNSTGKIGRITTAGEISEFPLPTPGSSPAGITNGPDGKLWFTIAGPNGQGGIGHLI